MPYQPMPADCFLRELDSIGVRSGRTTYCRGKRLFQWDELHGEVEVYNSRGKHLGVVDTSERWIKDAVRGRQIDV
jgi:hypothetical protein